MPQNNNKKICKNQYNLFAEKFYGLCVNSYGIGEMSFYKTEFEIRNESRPGLIGLFELFFCISTLNLDDNDLQKKASRESRNCAPKIKRNKIKFLPYNGASKNLKGFAFYLLKFS